MKKYGERKYYAMIMFIVIVYIAVAVVLKNISDLSTIVTTITALIAAVSFWIQLKRTETLEEAKFIMDLNEQFISNDEMTRVEHALELYFNQFRDENENCELSLDLSRDHEDCQRLINYLVYMEGMAALVKRNVLHLNVIDDLFAYRFFLAVNNPIVQEKELVPYAEYYRGCFELAEVWTKAWRKAGRTVPMDKYALCDRSQLLPHKPRNARRIKNG